MKNVMRTIVRVVSDDKRNWTDTLKPKGMESDYNDWQCIIRNGQVVSGSKMASMVFISIRDVELGKPYMLPKYSGRNSVMSNDGIEGRGIGKKRMSVCNGLNRGSKFALTRKGADLPVVFRCMNGGKPTNVSSSITPLICERLTDIRSKLQWADVEWNKVEIHVNRRQARITKAVMNCCPIQKGLCNA